MKHRRQQSGQPPQLLLLKLRQRLLRKLLSKRGLNSLDSSKYINNSRMKGQTWIAVQGFPEDMRVVFKVK